MKPRHHALETWSDARAQTLEETLWWWVGRAILARHLEQAAGLRPLHRILEIGCGSGGDLATLARFAPVVGVDQSPILVRRARTRGIAAEVHEADFFELSARPDFDARFDLVCLFDVLEHIEDDAGFLRRIADRLGTGDLLLISVPAGPGLYGPHDRKLGHYRRYTRPDLTALLEASGFETITSSHFVFFAWPAVALARLLERLRSGRRQIAQGGGGAECGGEEPGEVSLGQVPRPLSTLLIISLRIEGWLSRFVGLPVGAWVLALARMRGCSSSDWSEA